MNFGEFLSLVATVRVGGAQHGGLERLVRAAAPQVIPSSKFWLYEEGTPILHRPMVARGEAARLHGRKEPLSRLDLALRQLGAGGVAGAVAKTTVAPFERVKLLCQIAGLQNVMAARGSSAAVAATSVRAGAAEAAAPIPGVFRTFRRVYVNDGIAGFWRGNLANVIRIIPNKATLFFCNDTYKGWFKDRDGNLVRARDPLAGGRAAPLTPVPTAVPGPPPPRGGHVRRQLRARHLPAGPHSCAGRRRSPPMARPAAHRAPATAGSRLASQEGSARQYEGIVDCFRQIVRRDGMRGLYHGMGPTLAGIIPYMGLNFTIYPLLKKEAAKLQGGEVGIVSGLACGAVSGVVSQSLSFPIDTVRRRMQLQGAYTQPGERLYRHSVHCFTAVIRQEGAVALYRGLAANLLRAAPNVAVQFTAYELFSEAFGVV